jgi:hypothetical protein
VPIKLMNCTLEKFSVLQHEYPELFDLEKGTPFSLNWNEKFLKVFRFPTYMSSIPLHKTEKYEEEPIEIEPKEESLKLQVMSSENEEKANFSDDSESISSRYSSSSASSISLSKIVKEKTHSSGPSGNFKKVFRVERDWEGPFHFFNYYLIKNNTTMIKS